MKYVKMKFLLFNKRCVYFGTFELSLTDILQVNICKFIFQYLFANPTNTSSRLKGPTCLRHHVNKFIKYFSTIICLHFVVIAVAFKDAVYGGWFIVPVFFASLVPFFNTPYAVSFQFCFFFFVVLFLLNLISV